MLFLALIFTLFTHPVVLDSEVFELKKHNEIWLEKVEIDQYEWTNFDSIFLDMNKLELLMDNLESKIYKEPMNAKFGKNNEIIEGKYGITLDRNEFLEKFITHYYSATNEKLNVPLREIYPKVDSGLLKEISAKQLGSYVTFFRSSNKERSHNISLATEAIDNTVVFPGETFSFNDIVGERTKEKGYKRAPVIVRGELSEDIGGGICQVSSTLFNAIDLKGIQIVERYAHSKRVPYVPPGRDATVSWWGPDFVFKNLYNEPILIRAKAGNGKMIVTIYSTESAENFTGN
ncbi:VanW family protein [Oceanobacillus sp. Castelsardo]|uniref:VanW family protein n=1 Tax=Oceanobacillus sp. Castelsardo TaxID=1851204 RepID=UPI000838535A|nr:VanW family protein [Oceanobacillus sp. Castelsardo]